MHFNSFIYWMYSGAKPLTILLRSLFATGCIDGKEDNNSVLFSANSITSSKDFDCMYICLDIISICLDVLVTNSELDRFSRCLYLFTPPDPVSYR